MRDLNLLLVTPIDYVEMWNNVEHGRVRHYRAQGVPMTVVHMKLNHSPKLSHMLRDTVTFKVRERHEDGTRFLAVDPLFNYCGGVRTGSDASVKAASGRGKSRKPLKHYLIRALAPLAVMRDVFFTPCFVLAVLMKTRGEKFDAALCVGPWGSLVGLILKKLGKVRVLVYEDRDYEPGLMPDRLRQWYVGVAEKLVQRRSDLIISVGHKLAALRKELGGVDAVVISNGMEWEKMAAARESSGHGRTLVYVGNLSSWSGVEQNMRAMPELVKALPGVRMLVVGSGVAEYEGYLKKLAIDLGVADAVEFAGSQPHEKLGEFMARGAIGLANSEPVPYRKYACPLKVIEYMAAGLPVIATEETEAADMVRRYGCGVAAGYVPAAIAQAVQSVLSDPGEYQRMRENAIRESRELDWTRLLARERSLIEQRFERGSEAGSLTGQPAHIKGVS